ncbi:MAG TPA: addiction module protein [Thermoanaerobaculia bacterium]|jgi:putative addiction module component (TIGR02574 family)|nr:addiction module protein [Thermoanaerobaculia bacterium]
MNAAAKLREIEMLTVDERIDLVQAIWDGIAAETESLELSEGEKPELDRRIAELDEQPANVRTWEEIKTRVRARR